MSIEHDLRRALRRQPAPDDLADRVLAQLEAANRPARSRPAWRHEAAWWLGAAATLGLIATGGARYYADRQAAAEAERVSEEIRLALQITSETLAHVQQVVETSLSRQSQGTP